MESRDRNLTHRAVVDVLRGLYRSAGSPTAAFLAQHNITVTQAPHTNPIPNADLFTVENHWSPEYLECLLNPPPFKDYYSPINWAWHIGGRAQGLSHELAGEQGYWDWNPWHEISPGNLPPVTMVREPCAEDRWQKALCRAAWDTEPKAPAWRSKLVIAMGDFCGGHERRDVLGCIVPIRPQPGGAAQAEPQLYRAELSCALYLLHRQLIRRWPAEPTVTIIAVTDARIRVHQASVIEPTTATGAPAIHIAKRLDLSLQDVTGDGNAKGIDGTSVRDNWLNVMSYICFADRKHFTDRKVADDDDEPVAEPTAIAEPAEPIPKLPTANEPLALCNGFDASDTISNRSNAPGAGAPELASDSHAKPTPAPPVSKPRSVLGQIAPNAVATKTADKATSPRKSASPVKAATVSGGGHSAQK